MKPRKVVVTIEMLSDQPIKVLEQDCWTDCLSRGAIVRQVQVNVIKDKK